MLRLGIEFVPDRPVREVVEWAVLAERAGFDHIWVTDHYNNRNLWATITAIALNTHRIHIGPGVTNPYHTSPALSASAAVTIDELTGGRAVVGMGAGDRVTLDTLGLKWDRPVTTVIEAIKVIRALTDGERVYFDGRAFKMRGAKLGFVKKQPVLDAGGRTVVVDGRPVRRGRRIPIYAGAQGPQMLERTAMVADGVLINASHPDDIREAVRLIRRGARRAGRRPEEIDVGAYTAFSIAETLEDALAPSLRLIVAYIAAGSPSQVLERHDIDPDTTDMIKRALERGDYQGASSMVTPDMIDAFSVAGTARDCIDRAVELVGAGITHFVVGSPIGPDRPTAIRYTGEAFVPRLRAIYGVEDGT